MAMTDMRTFSPKLPNLNEIGLDQIAFDYDARSDTLLVSLAGAPQPAISVLIDGNRYYRVDPETEDVVGFYVENFLAQAVYDAPGLLVIADLVGIDHGEVERIRARLTPEQQRRAAVASLLGAPALVGAASGRKPGVLATAAARV